MTARDKMKERGMEGGYTPARPKEKTRPQVGPMPTDDPDKKATATKPKIDAALKTSGAVAADEDADELPEEGAGKIRTDARDPIKP
jgi:hypothetical protein